MTRVSILACIVALSMTSLAQDDSKPGSHKGTANHFDIVLKTGTVWGQPFKTNVEDVHDRIYELEVDYSVGHVVFSAFGAACVPEVPVYEPTSNQYECGLLVGLNWVYGRSMFEAKTGPVFMKGEYSVMNANNYSSADNFTEFETLGGMAELSYRYHLYHHLLIGVDVPFCLNRFFYYRGGALSLGYVIGS